MKLKYLPLWVAAAALLAACSNSDNTEPPTPLVEFTPSVQVKQVWSASVGSGSGDVLLGLVPAVDGSRVFTAGRDGEVSAYNVADGQRLWRADTDLKIGGGPGVGNDAIVVGSSDGYVQALSPADGHKLWQQYVDSAVITAPAVGAGVVAVRTADGHVVGLSTADGHQLWSVSRDEPRLTLRGNAAPVIASGIVYAGLDNGNLLAIQLQDGQVLWEAPISAPTGENELQQLVDLDGQPIVGPGIVYAANYQGRIAALTASGGQPLWTSKLSSYTGVSLGDGQAYVTDDESIVHALDAAGGTSVWKQVAMRARFLTRPTPFHGTVAVGDLEGYVHFLSQKTGELVARVQPDSARITAAPVVAGDTLLVLNDDGELYAFRFPAADTE